MHRLRVPQRRAIRIASHEATTLRLFSTAFNVSVIGTLRRLPPFVLPVCPWRVWWLTTHRVG